MDRCGVSRVEGRREEESEERRRREREGGRWGKREREGRGIEATRGGSEVDEGRLQVMDNF